MKSLKVVNVGTYELEFDDGTILVSHHEQSCCENHYLWMCDLSIADFDGLLFDLDGDNFFECVEGYGIRLLPINGLPIAIPAYAENNGFYSSNLTLCIRNNNLNVNKEYDIEKCQSSRDWY